MKNTLIVMIASVGITGLASANPVTISQRRVLLNINISPKTLKLSQADYSTPVVKVLVPELADVTILDHRNAGEGAPCLATKQTNDPNQVIQDRPAIEKTPVFIRLQRNATLDPSGKLCNVQLIEQIRTQIRGTLFEHLRNVFVGTRDISDCR